MDLWETALQLSSEVSLTLLEIGENNNFSYIKIIIHMFFKPQTLLLTSFEF